MGSVPEDWLCRGDRALPSGASGEMELDEMSLPSLGVLSRDLHACLRGQQECGWCFHLLPRAASPLGAWALNGGCHLPFPLQHLPVLLPRRVLGGAPFAKQALSLGSKVGNEAAEKTSQSRQDPLFNDDTIFVGIQILTEMLDYILETERRVEHSGKLKHWARNCGHHRGLWTRHVTLSTCLRGQLQPRKNTWSFS